MTRFFNENAPVVQQKVGIDIMSQEIEQLKQAIRLLAEEGDKEIRSLENDIYLNKEALDGELTVLKSQLTSLSITQKSTAKTCGILLVLVGVLIVSQIASFIL